MIVDRKEMGQASKVLEAAGICPTLVKALKFFEHGGGPADLIDKEMYFLVKAWDTEFLREMAAEEDIELTSAQLVNVLNSIDMTAMEDSSRENELIMEAVRREVNPNGLTEAALSTRG